MADHYKDESYQLLTPKEIDAFFDDIDSDKDNAITIDELLAKLEQVYMELAPDAKPFNLHHPDRRFAGLSRARESAIGDPERDGLLAFLHSLLPGFNTNITREEFTKQVSTWNIPSQNQTSVEEEEKRDAQFEQNLSWRRRLRAFWSVQGPKVLFITIVVALTVAFSLWQGIKYVTDDEVRTALGWGVILAKFCAGALYPIMFFVLLSMSRHFATAMRHFYWISRIINWDRSQHFHILMACAALGFATLHSIGHLTGTFLYGSRPAQQNALIKIVGEDAVPKPYINFVRTTPGWSGITALGLFWIISLLSMPYIRKRSYELFQVGHLLMFPFLAMLFIHGTARILQYPMMGYFLAVPTLFIVGERIARVLRGFVPVPAHMQILDDETVTLTCDQPSGVPWRFQAGQYVFLQVPALSWLQWHPFTVSACNGTHLQLHIKTDGNWTSRLRSLPTDKQLRVGIDGPFGAPAQRFYEFNRALVVGAGVGITPFSAILTDLEQHLSRVSDPWAKSTRKKIRKQSTYSATSSAQKLGTGSEKPREGSTSSTDSGEVTASTEESDTGTSTPASHASGRVRPNRRVDFHWMVRDKNHLLWFSALLNRMFDLSFALPAGTLELRMSTHITQKRNNISTHVFRYLLDSYRHPSAPVSALTGLKMRSHFGRPDLHQILFDYHADLLKQNWVGGKVGVFFCGSPVVGRILADACAELTARARSDKSYIKYVFMMEVFG